ncbi:MAG: MMPL family transporter [Gemmatimonadales bacterium]|nr:MMPL family transporter [Gemmatimonadales bacterium]
MAAWLTLMAAAATMAVARFEIDNGVAVWFGADDPALVTYRQAVRDFGGREWLVVGLDQGSAALGERNTDRDTFAEQLRRLPHAGMVLTSADVPAGSDVARTLLRVEPFPGMEAVLFQVENDLDRQDHYREQLVDRVRAIGTTLPTVRGVHVAGAAAINGELNRAARHDMFRFFPAVGVLLALVGLLVFRNARDALVLVATALGTVTLVAGALAAAGHALNMVTIMLPTVLIALSVAGAVHLIHAFHVERDAPAAIRAVWKPACATTLTTVAGFLAFGGSDVLPIQQLAVFGAFGIALALMLTVSFTPALLVLLWHGRPARSRTSRLPASTQWLARLHQMPRRVLVITGVLGLLLTGLALLEADTDYAAFFRAGSQVPADYAAMREAGLPVNALNFIVGVPTGDDPLAPRHAAALGAFSGALRSVPGVHSVLSPLSFATLPGGTAALMGAGLLSGDRQALQVVVLTQATSSRELFALLSAIEPIAISTFAPGTSVVPTGTPYLWARMDDGVIRTQVDSLLVVCIACLLVLTWLLRSLRLALLTLAVSLYPVALVLGLMGWLRLPINLATVLIAGIAVGIAVDDTIHLVHAWQERRRAGSNRHDAADDAVAALGARLAATSAVLVGAFAVMGFSDFLPTAQFGLLSALVIVLALAADLALTPVLLALGSPRRRAA